MADPIPPYAKHAIAHLVVDNGAEALDYYKKAFGAEEKMRMPSPDGSKIMHAMITIGDSVIYLCDDFPEFNNGQHRAPKSTGSTSVTIHQYVTDCDAAIKRAEEAGGTVVMPASDTFWGDRYGKVVDPFGHEWSFATHQKDMTPEEMMEAAKTAFS